MVLSPHCPISFSRFVACAILLSVPIESDQCALVQALPFRLLPGSKGRSRKGRASCCERPLLLWMLSAGQEPSGAQVSGAMLQKEQRRSRGRASVLLSPRGLVNVECGEEGGRVISKADSGAIQPASTHFPRPFPVGRPLLRSVSLRL